MGLGMPAPLPPPGAGTTTIMTTMGTMSSGNISSSMTAMRPGMSSAPQCRQPPAYKVAQQMARLHRLGRANSHEGVTYRATDHEDGTTTSNQIALPLTHTQVTLSRLHLYTSIRFTLVLRLLILAIVNIHARRRVLIFIGENTALSRLTRYIGVNFRLYSLRTILTCNAFIDFFLLNVFFFFFIVRVLPKVALTLTFCYAFSILLYII